MHPITRTRIVNSLRAQITPKETHTKQKHIMPSSFNRKKKLLMESKISSDGCCIQIHGKKLLTTIFIVFANKKLQ